MLTHRTYDNYGCEGKGREEREREREPGERLIKVTSIDTANAGYPGSLLELPKLPNPRGSKYR